MEYMLTVSIQIPIEAETPSEYIEARDKILGELEDKYSMFVDVVSEDFDEEYFEDYDDDYDDDYDEDDEDGF